MAGILQREINLRTSFLTPTQKRVSVGELVVRRGKVGIWPKLVWVVIAAACLYLIFGLGTAE